MHLHPQTMRRRAPLAPLAALLGLAACGGGTPAGGPPPGPVPQVILITLDTLRASHTTPYGHERDTTPNLARFAAGAVQFDRAYVAMPTTGPSHLSILTGLYPRQHGSQANGFPARPGLAGLPALMRASGRRTAAFVSVKHLSREAIGLDGFEVWDVPEGVRDGGATVDRAMAWVREHAGEPFFLWLHLFDPHFPYRVHDGGPAALAELLAPLEGQPVPDLHSFVGEMLTDRAAEKMALLYEGEVVHMDRHLGRFLDLVEQEGLAGRALIAVTSDHGEVLDELLAERRYAFDHGDFLTAEEIRAALWVRHPGVPGGRHDDTVVETRALFGSLLWAAGIEGHDGAPRLPGFGRDQGRGVEPGVGLAFVSRRSFQFQGIRMRRGERVGLVRGGFYARWWEEQPDVLELFDLAADPGGGTEVSDLHADLAGLYGEILERWRRSLVEAAGEGPIQTMSAEMEDHLRALGY